ncbi:MAG TPA: hypothetical protein H9663_03930, partial [Firmicutes bacterium]|nr:hypothetical protein [Bacillota bacterium]
VKIFASDFCEDDAVIPRYCKEDEQKDAEKIPPKAWFVFFPYSITQPHIFCKIFSENRRIFCKKVLKKNRRTGIM